MCLRCIVLEELVKKLVEKSSEPEMETEQDSPASPDNYTPDDELAVLISDTLDSIRPENVKVEANESYVTLIVSGYRR